VRVRQQFLNQDNWLVTAVYENKNEKIAKYKAEEVIGSYEFINHGNAEKDGNMLPTKTVVLEKNGSVTGGETGTWSMTDGESYTYVTLTLSGTAYNGVFFRQTDDNNKAKMTFTAIGKNNLAIWGSSNF
jgi:VCBS repeat-containing protein